MPEPTFYPQILPEWVRSLAAGVPEPPPGTDPLPPAPTGTIFALTVEGGWAVPPRRYELSFGRDHENVHIPIGVGDKSISRRHGTLVCHGLEWTVRNEGRLPMVFPGDTMLLSGQERVLEDAYTPVFIGDLGRRVHALEIRLVGGRIDPGVSGSADETVVPADHRLGDTERLVLTSLAQRYLLGLPHPQPASWKQVADDMNEVSGPDRSWSEKSAARVVAAVRDRLSDTVPGLRREEVLGEPIGNALNDNLIRALLQSATLTPEDLRLHPRIER